MKAKAIPDGFQTLTPSLVVRNAVAAIEFYERAFGAKRRLVFNAPDGSIAHAEIQIGDSIMMLSDEYPKNEHFLSPITRWRHKCQACLCMLRMQMLFLRKLFPQVPR